MSLKKYFGPGTLVAAAFVGPGTVTLCTLAGATAGYNLLWTLILAVFTTIIFQEMSARLGLITGEGLGEAVRKSAFNPAIKAVFIFIVIGAIIIGNAAYEAGNISGAVLGMELLVGNAKLIPIVMGLLASIMLYFGKFKWVANLLIVLVIVMSICFFITAIVVQPSIKEIAAGFIPNASDFSEHILLIIGLIGTTVVPYNLFLHASSISEKWNNEKDLKDVRIENWIAVVLGGFISLCIIITSAAVLKDSGSFSGVADFAKQLEPVFGTNAKFIMAIGFFAAGLSSSITAPLAAAYAARGLFGWEQRWTENKFRSVWAIILVLGVVFSSLGFKPILVIKFAQIANGLLLPVIAIFLLFLVNQKAILGNYVNSRTRNTVACITLLLIIMISTRSLLKVFGIV